MCVSWNTIFPPRGCCSCVWYLFQLPGYPLWLSACPWAWSKDYVGVGGGRAVLLLIKCLDNVNLCLARYASYYSTIKGDTSGPEAAGRVVGEGSLCILGCPSAEVATSSQCQQTCRAKFPFSTPSGHRWASQHPSFLNTKQESPSSPLQKPKHLSFGCGLGAHLILGAPCAHACPPTPRHSYRTPLPQLQQVPVLLNTLSRSCTQLPKACDSTKSI